MSAPPRDQRLDMRLPAEQKSLIERAAALSGVPVSAFAVEALVARARSVIAAAEATSSPREIGNNSWRSSTMTGRFPRWSRLPSGTGMPDGWGVERLRPDHDRTLFDSGEPTLDDWLRRFARQNDEKEIGRTFVAVRGGSPRVHGYHTLRTGSVAHTLLPEPLARKLPRYPVPVVHLARLAVDRTVRGERLGERLLLHALDLALRVSDSVAVYAVEVVALNDVARGFYGRYGFTPLEDDPNHMYVSIAAVRASLRG